MNITGPIKALIAANSTANGLLAGRVYPGIFPEQYTLPAVAINIVSGIPNPTKTAPGDVDTLRVQVDCYGTTYTSAQATADAVRGAIDWYRGNVVSGLNSYAIDWINFEGTQDSWESEPKEWRIITEYSARILRSNADIITQSAVGLQRYSSDQDALDAGVQYGEFYVADTIHEYAFSGALIQLFQP